MSILHPLERLVAAIRNPATTMEDLTRMVGPDPVEAERQTARLRALDQLWSRADLEGWGSDPEQWPHPYGQQHLSFKAASDAFERRYC